MGDGAAKDKTARLDPGDLVDLRAGPGLDQLVHRAPERPRVAEQCRNVPEKDAFFGIVGNGANGGGERHGGSVIAGFGQDRAWGLRRKPPCRSGSFFEQPPLPLDLGGKRLHLRFDRNRNEFDPRR